MSLYVGAELHAEGVGEFSVSLAWKQLGDEASIHIGSMIISSMWFLFRIR